MVYMIMIMVYSLYIMLHLSALILLKIELSGMFNKGNSKYGSKSYEYHEVKHERCYSKNPKGTSAK